MLFRTHTGALIEVIKMNHHTDKLYYLKLISIIKSPPTPCPTSK